MKYREGYKYQLYADEEFRTGIFGKNIKTDFIELFANGVLICRKGYAWDGASGPTIDTKNSMRAALLHDAGYQLMREKLLSLDYKAYFDEEFYRILRADGMSWIRAWIWYNAVRDFGKSSTLPENDRPILEAP
jgi:hypothetical protein